MEPAVLAPGRSSDDRLGAAAHPLGAIRTRGRLAAGFARREAVTHPRAVTEADGFRLRFPWEAGGLTAVTINTGGGMTGGDALQQDFALAAGADVAITSQAAEKFYRADGVPATIATRLILAEGARLDWIPQESILFDGAMAERRIEVEMAPDARLLLAEQVVLGRLAMGERIGAASLRDRWRVRRGGRLVFAEAVDLAGPLFARLDRPAIGGGARAFATILLADDTASAGLLDPVRERLSDEAVAAGASVFDGLLVVRMLAADPARLRDQAIRVIELLRSRPMPRCW